MLKGHRGADLARRGGGVQRPRRVVSRKTKTMEIPGMCCSVGRTHTVRSEFACEEFLNTKKNKKKSMN